jgi:YggT family protein
MLTILIWVLEEFVYYYIMAVVISAVLVTLGSFGVLDTRNRIVWTISDFFYRLTEPGLRPIRRMLPNFGGIDISPLVLILLLQAARMLLFRIDEAVHFGTLRPLFL